jgi:hypothetical protein
MHWWQIPLFIAVAAWALYLYSTPEIEGQLTSVSERNLPHYRGRPLDLSWTVGLSEKAVGKREQ